MSTPTPLAVDLSAGPSPLHALCACIFDPHMFQLSELFWVGKVADARPTPAGLAGLQCVLYDIIEAMPSTNQQLRAFLKLFPSVTLLSRWPLPGVEPSLYQLLPAPQAMPSISMSTPQVPLLQPMSAMQVVPCMSTQMPVSQSTAFFDATCIPMISFPTQQQQQQQLLQLAQLQPTGYASAAFSNTAPITAFTPLSAPSASSSFSSASSSFSFSSSSSSSSSPSASPSTNNEKRQARPSCGRASKKSKLGPARTVAGDSTQTGAHLDQ